MLKLKYQIWYIHLGEKIMSFEPKKSALLRMLQIFGEYSDEQHPLKQADIIRLLKENYDIEIERKAIGRNISLLKDAGVNLVSTRKGSFLEGQAFEKNEIRILIDAVLASKFIDTVNAENIIGKLIEMGGNQFQNHFKHVYAVDFWEKSNKSQLFENIEVIDHALDKLQKISFVYAGRRVFASPYQMILDNQKYYLMVLEDSAKQVSFYQVDKMEQIVVENEKVVSLVTIKGYEKGINFKQLSLTKPYLKNN